MFLTENYDILLADKYTSVRPLITHKGCAKMVLDTLIRENPIDYSIQDQVKEDPDNYSGRKPDIEESKAYTKHDLLFKQLINNFFKEFLEAFFPEVYQHVDFAAIKPMSEEVHTDLIDGKTRRLDIVVETKLKGEDVAIIIHVEPQSSGQPNFHERMYHYFSLLYNKYRKPILPIAVFSYEENRREQDEFTISFPFFDVLTFNFLMLELRKKNWRDYIQSNNPVAAALLSKMGYTEKEKVEVKKEFLGMLVRMELNPAKSKFINDFFEIYLKLNEEEEEQLMKEIREMDNADDILDLPNSWEERGIKKGIEKGIEKGKEQGKEQGIKQATRELAVSLLKEGSAVEFVAKVTRLNAEEIEKIRKSYNL